MAPDDKLIDMCAGMVRRDNVLLVLVTNGGDANIAYRIARCLQRSYERFHLFVPGWCKSAGTLIAIGADEIVMTEQGQLGPIDVQISKPDELFENTSGLDTIQAMNFLKDRAFTSFEDSFIDLKIRSNNRLSTKTATEIATNLATGLFQPIYQQIEPTRLGEIARAMSIAQEYGQRLNSKSDNLRGRALQKLVSGYPTHKFVIDREEARDLFRRVREPKEDEQALVDSLEAFVEGLTREPNVLSPSADSNPEPFTMFVSTDLGRGEEQDEGQNGAANTEGERKEAESAPRGTGQDLAAHIAPDGQEGRE